MCIDLQEIFCLTYQASSARSNPSLSCSGKKLKDGAYAITISELIISTNKIEEHKSAANSGFVLLYSTYLNSPLDNQIVHNIAEEGSNPP